MTNVVDLVSVRGELAEFIREQYESEDELSTGQLIIRCQDHFEHDTGFRSALAREALKILVPTIAGSVRHGLRKSSDGTETPRERFARMFAYIGDDRSKSFLAMRRPEHLFAAEDLEAKAKGALSRATLHRAAAALLPDDKLATGEVLTDGQLSKLENQWLTTEEPSAPWLTK